MTHEKRQNWIVVVSGDPERRDFQVLNLDQVRIVDQISRDHIRFWFSESHSVELTGKPAAELAQFIFSRGVTADGKPTPDVGALKTLA